MFERLVSQKRQIKLMKSRFKAGVPQGMNKALDLGCGDSPSNPSKAKEVFGVDFRANQDENVVAADLARDPIPFADENFDVVTAYDFLEHIPRVNLEKNGSTFPFVNLMSEIHRVLVPGGVFYSLTPVFPAKEAFQDPTHVNIMSADTIRLYFCGVPWAATYGFEKAFDWEFGGWVNGHHYSLIRKSSLS
jgi:SAM-dependent methyltransferase